MAIRYPKRWEGIAEMNFRSPRFLPAVAREVVEGNLVSVENPLRKENHLRKEDRLRKEREQEGNLIKILSEDVNYKLFNLSLSSSLS